jgi:NADPH-dependent glutamate synthase beta subunit-like oxidoreductase/NAD(P)H-flavin reductase
MQEDKNISDILTLKGFSFAELQTPSGLERLDESFLKHLRQENNNIYNKLLDYRNSIVSNESEFLIELAREVDKFVADLFQVQEYTNKQMHEWLKLDPIINFKNLVVIKEARRKIKNISELDDFSSLHNWLLDELTNECDTIEDIEMSVSEYSMFLLANREKYNLEFEKLVSWATHCLITQAAQDFVKDWVSFSLPKKIISSELVSIPNNNFNTRDGFALTDSGKSFREIKSDIAQCIFCHDKKGDFCSTGFPKSKKDLDQGYKKNDLDNLLHGCPLEQKISEMNLLKKYGYSIAPLVMIMRDNPTCALTGHRICNDCQKSCIFQKQEPVDVPQIETRILKDVLSLPWGVEIYDLFTKWNPLLPSNYLLPKFNGRKVLVMGMGPAGITLSHYLLMQGCAVTGMDGLKIEELPDTLLHNPIRDFSSLNDNLAKRTTLGFGGVAEYGITARWNKNYLKLAYISLLRKKYFSILGSVRFGGTITISDAWDLGFDHVSIAVGAGLPKEINLPGSLAKGMRAANDFLMALHLTGGVEKENISNLQVELPAVVIGGGLTGVDTATELQAYYIDQVERILKRYEEIEERFGEDKMSQYFSDISLPKLETFLNHGRQVRACRNNAKKNGVKPNFMPLLHEWGGVTIVYRKEMIESPAYRNNHFELQQALLEGVLYEENYNPDVVLLDKNDNVCGLSATNIVSKTTKNFKAKNIFVATGAKPNVAYAFEHANDIERSGFGYVLYTENNGKLEKSSDVDHCKSKNISVFSSYTEHNHKVSVIGDTNPAFHGSVVKAIASAKNSYKDIMESMRSLPIKDISYDKHKAALEFFKVSTITALKDCGNYIKVTIHAPFALRNFKPGNFFRIQNYSSLSTYNFIEPVTVFPAEIIGDSFDCYLSKEDTLALRLNWEIGSNIAVMGPTGVRTIVKGYHKHTLMLLDSSQIGPGLLMAKSIKAHNYKIDRVVVVDDESDLYAKNDLKQVSDNFNIVRSLSDINFNYTDVTSVIIKGGHEIVTSGSSLCKNTKFTKNPKLSATVLGPMQCMLKGVCAQCLQWQIDPSTGERTKAVYSCSWQEQPLEIISLDHLAWRNDKDFNVVSKLNRLWLEHSV